MCHNDRSLLIDFDRVAHGPPEADYGRLWAFFTEGRLDDDLFAQLYENSPENPSYGLTSSYGRLYVIRDATWLATRAALLTDDELSRLHACSHVLGLVMPESITFGE